MLTRSRAKQIKADAAAKQPKKEEEAKEETKEEREWKESVPLRESLSPSELKQHVVWKWLPNHSSYSNPRVDPEDCTRLVAEDGARGIAILSFPVLPHQVVTLQVKVGCESAQMTGPNLVLNSLDTLLVGALSLKEIAALDFYSPLPKSCGGYYTDLDGLRSMNLQQLMLAMNDALYGEQFLSRQYFIKDSTGKTTEQYANFKMGARFPTAMRTFCINRGPSGNYLGLNFNDVGSESITLLPDTFDPLYFCFFVQSGKDNVDFVQIHSVTVVNHPVTPIPS